MSETVFPYPGGKSNMCDWIIDHFPRHDCYIEVFGGGASVLMNKEQSDVEIYNDRDGDLVHFFRVLRERDDELREWLRNRPHAKDLHEKYAGAYYDGYRPKDDVERAGRFFYLRYTQFAAKYNGFSGFNSASSVNQASRRQTAVEKLEHFAERFRHVQIENRDFETLINRFDNEGVLFYCDPPYVEEGDDLYTGNAFEQERFINTLEDAEAMWAVSYTDLPESFDPPYVVESSEPNTMRNGQGDKKRDHRVERLAMNYDPDSVAQHTHPSQTSLF